MAYSANLNAHKADLYGKHGTFSYEDQNIAPILTLLDLQKGEHILDLGCGDGYLTHNLAFLVGDEGSVIGTDSNADMVGELSAITRYVHEDIPFNTCYSCLS
jgi:ubiquinone/menaquinone biosynthesis C-methylase UbiE